MYRSGTFFEMNVLSQVKVGGQEMNNSDKTVVPKILELDGTKLQDC